VTAGERRVSGVWRSRGRVWVHNFAVTTPPPPHRTSLPLLIALAAFVYTMFRPVSNNGVLVPALALLGVVALGSLTLHGMKVTRTLQAIMFVQFIAGLFALFIGSVNNTPGLWPDALVLIGGPLLFWICVLALRSWMLRPLLIATAFGTAVVSTAILLFVLSDKGLLPAILPEAVVRGSGGGIGQLDQSIAVRFYGLSTLVAAGPLWIASLLVPRSDLMPPAWLRFYAAVAALLAGIVTGRKALVLLLVLTPLFVWVVRRILHGPSSPQHLKGHTSLVVPGMLALAFAITVAFAAAPSVFSLNTVGQSISSVTDTVSGSGNYQDTIRTEESTELLQSWADSPLIGHGAGAIVQGYARDDARPWNFELQYHRLLQQQGLFGASCFLVVLLMVISFLRRAVEASPEHASVLVATTVAAAAMLVANATNPYLQAPGHMWSIYLPLGIASAVMSYTPDRARLNSRNTPARPHVARRGRAEYAGRQFGETKVFLRSRT